MLILKAIRKLRSAIRAKPRDGIEYWEQRAAEFGKRSVLNINHKEEDVERVTKGQKSILLPLLQRQLNGSERVILDFGCGPGRFTGDLARTIDGRAIGVDPISRFLRMAPPDERVEYKLLANGRIPCDDATTDVVWVCLVLGGLTAESEIRRATVEILRVLKPGGLLFLVENTSLKPNAANWHFRTVEAYQNYFPSIPIAQLSTYEDLDDVITIMAGRKSV